MVGQAGECGEKPKLVMVGDEDQFCSLESFERFVAALPEPKTTVVVPRCHHMAMARHIPCHLPGWVAASFGVPDLEAFGKTGDPHIGGLPQVLPQGYGEWPSGHDVAGFPAQAPLPPGDGAPG